MKRDERLEIISDKIRHGEPVGILEAIEAIDYQEARRAHAAANSWWKRLTAALRKPGGSA